MAHTFGFPTHAAAFLLRNQIKNWVKDGIETIATEKCSQMDPVLGILDRRSLREYLVVDFCGFHLRGRHSLYDSPHSACLGKSILDIQVYLHPVL